jgi:AhpD family alkylhydroperoxidase
VEVEGNWPSHVVPDWPFRLGQSDTSVEGMTTTSTTHERVDLQADARALYRAQCALDRAVRESAIDPRLHELVKIRASQINGCAYCIDMHTRDALSGGDTQRRLFALSAWRESPLFDERERAALALTDALTLIATHADAIDPAYEAAAEHFSSEELAALLYAIATIGTWNRLAVATHAVFEP